jgi:hypothetical protein
MEIQFKISEFNKLINSLENLKNRICYATNSLQIHYLPDLDDKKYFFHIDPPWRIVFNNKIIQNSYNYPYHSNYSDDQRKQEEEDFHTWCKLTEFMKNEKIKIVTAHENADLTIEWENHAVLNAFIDDDEGASYYFYDKVNYKVYEFEYSKCIQDDLKRN